MRFALVTLFPKRFGLKPSQEQLEFIDAIEVVIRSGGQLAVAMPRGTGKTSILICAVVWAIVCGLHPFVVLIGATGDAAKDLLEQIRSEFESNDNLYAYFPELIHPIRKLEGITQRRLLWNGQRIKQTWKKNRIILPDNPTGDGAGATIAVAGLDGRIRGMNHQRTDGENVRPTLVLIDDPQTRKSAHSPATTAKREQIINGDVMGLAGPGKVIAAFVACTVIVPNDLSDRLLDRKLHPEWQGKRTKLLRSLPKNLNLWDEYAGILREDLANDKGRRRATAFYRKNKKAMDEGAVPSWPARYEPRQLSAIQYAMDLRILNRESFEAEYQNEPLRQEDGSIRVITPDELMARVNMLKRGVVPTKAQFLTAGIDIQQDLLYWMVCWWTQNFTGGIVDYGETPDQKRHYFSLQEANPTLIQHTGRNAKMAAVRAGLDALIKYLMSRQFQRDNGSFAKIDRLCIDANWGESTSTIYSAVRESDHSQIIRPCHGRGFKVTEQPMSTWKEKEGDKNGIRWFRKVGTRGVKYLTVDTNYQKSFVHNGLLLLPEEEHSISLFNAPWHEHQMLADHLTSETKHCPKAEDGRTVDQWKAKIGKENHRFDTLVLCTVGASEMGCSLDDVRKPARPKRTGPIQAMY